MPLVSLDDTITLALSVRDRQASAEWYEKHLGFELLYHADEAGWSELQTKTAGVTLGLGEQSEPRGLASFGSLYLSYVCYSGGYSNRFQPDWLTPALTLRSNSSARWQATQSS